MYSATGISDSKSGQRRPLLEVQVGVELLHHGGQIPGHSGAVGGEVPVGIGQVGEGISNRLQDAVELVMLSDQLVPVHPVVPTRAANAG